MPPKVAAITMAYNEAEMLPVWTRYYARQVGADYCFVVDHGSTEPVIVPPGVNVVRLPRSAHDEQRRAAFISEFATSLLRYYDWVLYSDVDELIVPDPALYPNLPALCAQADGDAITCVGLDVQHVPALEQPLDLTQPVGQQRAWVRFTSAMCKPALTRQPIRWAPGFHCADTAMRFAPVYLFHLHWADQAFGLRRLAKTRGTDWAATSFVAHHHLADQPWLRMFSGMADLPQVPVTLALDADPVADWINRVRASCRGREHELYKLDLHVNAPELWRIPERFRDAL